MSRNLAVVAWLIAVAGGAPWGVRGQSPATPPAPAAAAQPAEKVADLPSLHNVYRIHERVLSGGVPEGESGFKALQKLGVRTIISVDGAQPDVARARRHGMRYVHLPHGYDGISAERGQQLGKAVLELDGPIYIHCHHGKHRSPAAAAVACVSAGLIAPEAAVPFLKAAGTSANYQGLYDAARRARPADLAQLRALAVEFHEREQIPPLAEAMVAVDERFGRLQKLAANDWQPLADHPDLVPSHEALMLRELLTELRRTEETGRQPPAFDKLLAEGERMAETLEQSLQDPRETAAQRHAHFQAVTANCAACHAQFRDVPLGERAGRR